MILHCVAAIVKVFQKKKIILSFISMPFTEGT